MRPWDARSSAPSPPSADRTYAMTQVAQSIEDLLKEGERLLDRAEFAESEKAYLSAAALGEKREERDQEAVAYRKIGELYGTKRQGEDALKYLRRAIRLNVERDDKLNLMRDYECLLWWLPDPSILAEAEALYRHMLENGNVEVASWAHSGLASVQLREKKLPEAEVEFKKALEGFGAIGDLSSAGDQLTGLGLVYGDGEDRDQAILCVREAIAKYQEDGNRRRLDYPYSVLGNIYLGYDDEKALEYKQHCLNLFEELDVRVHRPTAYIGLAQPLRSMGRFQDAEAALLQALACAEEIELYHYIVEVRIKLAELYYADEHSDWAEEELCEILRIYENEGDKMGIARAHVNLGQLKVETGDLQAGRAYWTKAQMHFWTLQRLDLVEEVESYLRATAQSLGSAS